MPAPRLPADTERRPGDLAGKPGRTKSFYARAAVLGRLAGQGDACLAERRMRDDPELVEFEAVSRDLDIDLDAPSDRD